MYTSTVYFQANAAFIWMMACHVADKPYLCKLCEKMYKSKSTLSPTHVGSYRRKAIQMLSDVCDKGFIRSDCLKQHIWYTLETKRAYVAFVTKYLPHLVIWKDMSWFMLLTNHSDVKNGLHRYPSKQPKITLDYS